MKWKCWTAYRVHSYKWRTLDMARPRVHLQVALSASPGGLGQVLLAHWVSELREGGRPQEESDLRLGFRTPKVIDQINEQ